MSNDLVTVLPTITQSDALDTTSLTWTTGGNSNWIAQTTTTHDGVDAAESGQIGNSQSSYVQTTVTGPGTLTFWWKVSSEDGFDVLGFYNNGVEKATISAEVDWEKKTFALASGAQTLRWTYSKDSSASSGEDKGWLDQ